MAKTTRRRLVTKPIKRNVCTDGCLLRSVHALRRRQLHAHQPIHVPVAVTPVLQPHATPPLDVFVSLDDGSDGVPLALRHARGKAHLATQSLASLNGTNDRDAEVRPPPPAQLYQRIDHHATPLPSLDGSIFPKRPRKVLVLLLTQHARLLYALRVVDGFEVGGHIAVVWVFEERVMRVRHLIPQELVVQPSARRGIGRRSARVGLHVHPRRSSRGWRLRRCAMRLAPRVRRRHDPGARQPSLGNTRTCRHFATGWQLECVVLNHFFQERRCGGVTSRCRPFSKRPGYGSLFALGSWQFSGAVSAAMNQLPTSLA